MQALSDLAVSISALDGDELGALIRMLTQWRDAFATSRPRIADAANSLLAVLENDRSDRPARANAEVAELRRMLTGHHEDLDDGGGFGWAGDRPRQG